MKAWPASYVAPLPRKPERARACRLGLERAVPWGGSIEPERPAVRDVEVGGPQFEVLAVAQVTSDVYIALAAVDERLPGRIGAARAGGVVSRIEGQLAGLDQNYDRTRKKALRARRPLPRRTRYLQECRVGEGYQLAASSAHRPREHRGPAL